MFSFQLHVTVPDLDRHEIEIDGPLCKLSSWTTLGAIRRGDVAICRGCHASLRLSDHLGQYQRFKQRFERMFKSLEM